MSCVYWLAVYVRQRAIQAVRVRVIWKSVRANARTISVCVRVRDCVHACVHVCDKVRVYVHLSVCLVACGCVGRHYKLSV